MKKIDCTDPDSEPRAFMKQFNITGMPTFVFISANGKEIPELREIGFIHANKFAGKMNKTIAASKSD